MYQTTGQNVSTSAAKPDLDLHCTCTCEEHAPADDGDVKVAGLGHELEGPVQVEQGEDVLSKQESGVHMVNGRKQQDGRAAGARSALKSKGRGWVAGDRHADCTHRTSMLLAAPRFVACACRRRAHQEALVVGHIHGRLILLRQILQPLHLRHEHESPVTAHHSPMLVPAAPQHTDRDAQPPAATCRRATGAVL